MFCCHFSFKLHAIRTGVNTMLKFNQTISVMWGCKEIVKNFEKRRGFFPYAFLCFLKTYLSIFLFFFNKKF